VGAAVTGDFQHREVLGRTVLRMGLASNFGIEEAAIRAALERGMNYVYYTARGKLLAPLRDAFRRDRERYVVATGPLVAFLGGSVRRSAERALKRLETDYIDVFQLQWLGVTSAWTEGTLRELRHLKESGKVRALGISIHDRERAGRLAEEAPLDLLMIRYNMAHPGAERDIFPHLEKRKPAVVAYTATRWRKLLKRPSGWTGPVPTAGDCYRWCLSSPHVDIVLSGPASGAQLDENLAALAKGPVSAEEDRWMRELGRVVRGG
jgi:aryl-alcohol dehydrogenase-like predicted oxidoreductase